MILSIYILCFIFIVGLIVGSFLNVVILRTISEESIVFPGSKCPKCQNSLKWYHNIPLFSYLFLRGKCAYCKEHISWQYPLVEFLTACVFVGLFIVFCKPFDMIFGLSVMNDISFAQIIDYVFALIASCLFIVIAGTDIIEMCVATYHTYALMGIGLLYALITTIMNTSGKIIDVDYFLTSPVLCSIICLIIGFATMEIYRFIASKLAGKMAHGDGDAYIAGGIGAYIGALIAKNFEYINIIQASKIMLLVIAGAVIIASVIGMPMFLKNIIKDKVTFGTLITLIIYSLSLRFLADFVNQNIIILTISLIIFIILCIFFVKGILNGIKNHNSDGIPCPFGPSLVISAFIAMIVIQQIYSN